MVQVYSLSFWFILAFTIPLWLSARTRKEYGDRPFWLLVSLVLFAVSGILVNLYSLNIIDSASSLSLLLVLVPQVLYPVIFTIVEYSTHSQRIQKNLLQTEFNSRLKWIWVILAGIILSVLAILILPNKNLILVPLLILAALSTILYIYNFSLFSFEEGIIRDRKSVV